MKKIIGIFLIVGILFSCSNETLASSLIGTNQGDESTSQGLSSQELKAVINLKDDKTVSEEEVQARVLGFVNEMNDSQSRSTEVSNISISSYKKELFGSDVIIVDNDQVGEYSRSLDTVNTQENEDVALYLFNLSDSNGDAAGFAIASGDERLPAVLAYSDNGVLENDLTDDFLYSFFSRLPDYINNKLAEYYNVDDVDIDIALKKIENSQEESRATTNSMTIVEQHGPLIPVEWGQRAPYSDVINNVYNNTGLLSGCVAIAISQIMASHGHATGGTYDWSAMTSRTNANYLNTATRNMVGTLVYNVAEAVHMSYGTSSSGAYSKYADDCFDGMGYVTPSSLQGYNYDVIKSSIKNGNSVYTSAFAKKSTTKVKIFGITISSSTSYSEGHAYVVDGYSERRQEITFTLPSLFGSKTMTLNVPFNYLHVNFGWNGYKNGYYAAGTFDTTAGTEFTRSGTSGNYQYKIEILPNVSPR